MHRVDIAARADEPGKLPRAIERALVANLAMNRELGRLGLDGIEPAPPQFRELFERAPSISAAQRRDPLT